MGWLIGASLFFYISTYLFEDSILKRREYRIIRGKITYVDYGKEHPTLISKEYGLSGKPDYVLKNEDGHIPIEEKTGVIAKYPFFFSSLKRHITPVKKKSLHPPMVDRVQACTGYS